MNPEAEFTLFETDFGLAGLSWTSQGISGVRIPGHTADRMRADYQTEGARENEAPPQLAAEAVSLLQHYFSGEKTDLSHISLDMSGASAANLPIYQHIRTLGWGELATYGDIARLTGQPGAAQLVGQAMGANRIPIIIPCHRVVAASGRLGGFSAPGGSKTKARLLHMENARLREAGGQMSLF